MYTRPYVIEDVTDLLTIIHLADYYCCEFWPRTIVEHLSNSSLSSTPEPFGDYQYGFIGQPYV